MAAEINFYDNLHSVILKMPTGLLQEKKKIKNYEYTGIFAISTRWQQRANVPRQALPGYSQDSHKLAAEKENYNDIPWGAIF